MSSYGGRDPNQSMNRSLEYSAVPVIMRNTAQAPPRIRPYMIIIMVLSVGIMIVGAVMTIIAVWPGYTPIGGNPLKIAGPCLLGVGGLVFVLGIVNTCVHKDRRNEKMAAEVIATHTDMSHAGDTSQM